MPHQLELIVAVAPPPDDAAARVRPKALPLLTAATARAQPRVPLQRACPTAGADALSLLEAMLQFDERQRPTAAEALSHAYLSDLHDADQERRGRETPA